MRIALVAAKRLALLEGLAHLRVGKRQALRLPLGLFALGLVIAKVVDNDAHGRKSNAKPQALADAQPQEPT